MLQLSNSDQLAIMALSNPDTCAEITPSEFFSVKPNGIYASGTIFPDFPYNQANNMFVFPVVGKLSPSRGNIIKDDFFVKIAEKLANSVSEKDLYGKYRQIYPDNSQIADVIDNMICNF